MYRFIPVLLVVALAAFAGNGCKKDGHKDHSHKDHEHGKDKTAKTVEYVCPEPDHYQERSKEKGAKCPKCKKEMIKVGTYYCWMHDEPVIGKKGGSCDKCGGMKLVRAGSGKKKASDKARDKKGGTEKKEEK